MVSANKQNRCHVVYEVKELDKYEYNLKLEEINRLVDDENYEEAAEIADTIDWKRVRNVRTLCMVSEIYEANGRLEDSKDILMKAYRRTQMGRNVLYRLTEVCIKLREFDEAVEYYSEFVNAAPNDNAKYILKYKIYKGRGSSLEDQIAILEELKEKEYTEKWAYELAKLYHRAGDDKKCVEACDDLVLWFRQGKYVIKALELKMSITELTPVQKSIYEHRDEMREEPFEDEEPRVDDIEKVIMEKMPSSEEEALTDNIIQETQKELAQAVSEHAAQIQNETGMRPEELMWNRPQQEDRFFAGQEASVLADQGAAGAGDTKIMPAREVRAARNAALAQELRKEQPQAQPAPNYDTSNLQEELANSMREIVAGIRRPVSEEDIIEPKNDLSAFETAKPEIPEQPLSEIDQILTSMGGGTPKPEPAPESSAEAPAAETPTDAPAEDLPEAAATAELPMPQTDESTPDEGLYKSDEFTRQQELLEKQAAIAAQAALEAQKAAEEASKRAAEVQAFLEATRNKRSAEAEAARKAAEEETARKAAKEAAKIAAEESARRAAKEAAEAEAARKAAEEAVRKAKEEADRKAAEEAARKAAEENQGRPSEEGTAERPSEEPVKEAADAGDLGQEPERPQEPEKTPADSYRQTGLTRNQQNILGFFATINGLREQIAAAMEETIRKVLMDKTSKSGNLVITGSAGSGRSTLAMRYAKAVSRARGEKTARIAKIFAEDFNKKDIPATIAKIAGGTLIIEEAGDLSEEVVNQLGTAMEFRTDGLVLILEDEKPYLKELFDHHPDFAEKFTCAIHIPILTNDELVAFGQTYAVEEDFRIDDSAVQALYGRISDLQTSDHPVVVADVKEIVDGAIKRSERVGIRKLGMILSKKRYDTDDRIILYAKDFK